MTMQGGQLAIIKQRELQELLELSEAVGDLKRQAAEAAQTLELRSGGLVQLLEAGFTIEPGALTAAVKIETSRRVAWRTEFEKLAGKAAADALLQATPSKVSGKKLVISGTIE